MEGVFFLFSLLMESDVWRNLVETFAALELHNNIEERLCMQIAALWFVKYMMLTEDICDVFSRYRTTTVLLEW